ncbi:MAG: DNA-processing protein DprA [Patescibacteria group bacterium]
MEESRQWDESRLGWLTLSWNTGLSAMVKRRLYERFDRDGTKVAKINKQDLFAAGATPEASALFISWRSTADADSFAARCEKDEVRLVLPWDDEFPKLLTTTAEPPACLFLRGAKLSLENSVAVVGTRRMTSYGRRATKELTEGLATAGCTIVSGLALGIDGVAHAAALDAGGRTVAVLGGGCDTATVYPVEHARLADRIASGNGTVLSEMPPGTNCQKYHFLQRNRIIAGLSRALVVVEAPERSGALVTAKYALEESREVFVVPGPITNEQSRGTNAFLKYGAAPCTEPRDILETLGIEAATVAVANLTADEHALIAALDVPKYADDLCRELKCPASTLSVTASSLELRGLLEREAGGTYTRTNRSVATISFDKTPNHTYLHEH